MVRRLCALLLVVLPAVGGTAQAKPVGTTHIHCLDTLVARIFRDALARSSTVSRLTERIERSDVLVLLAAKLTDGGLVGKTQMVTAAPGARYVMVTIDPRAISTDLVGRLAHELQHVAEIADAPDVKDQIGLGALLQRIGWRRGWAGNWETQAAIDTGRLATREAGDRPAHVGDLARYGRPSPEHR